MEESAKEDYEIVREYYNYKVESYENKYRSGVITHLHTGLFSSPLDYSTITDQIEIQKQLIQGQSSLTQNVISLIPPDAYQVLDIGSGHGGTAFTYLSDREGIMDTLTISDHQAALVKVRAAELGFEDRLNIILDNVLTHDFSGKRYDTVLSIESFCHINHIDQLATVVANILKPGGSLILSDYYTSDVVFKQKFDKHWRCAIKPFDQLRKAFDQAGITLKEQIDLTSTQAPFWKLSATHSALRLQKVHPMQEKNRLVASRAFHEYMFDAFLNRVGQYYITVFEKR